MSLLAPTDPDPVDVINESSQNRLLLVCEHAGRDVPTALGDLGISDEERQRHIAYDIGAEEVSRLLSDRLGTSLILQRYSRLVIDCNRPPRTKESIRADSDGTEIPANRELTDEDKSAREVEIFQPFHDQTKQQLDRIAGSFGEPILIAIHSFTPRMRTSSFDRPWHIGLLFNRYATLAETLMLRLSDDAPDLNRAYNQPYSVDDKTDYSIPVHGEARGIPHVLVEIRNDLIADHQGQERMAMVLAKAIGT